MAGAERPQQVILDRAQLPRTVVGQNLPEPLFPSNTQFLFDRREFPEISRHLSINTSGNIIPAESIGRDEQDGRYAYFATFSPAVLGLVEGPTSFDLWLDSITDRRERPVRNNIAIANSGDPIKVKIAANYELSKIEKREQVPEMDEKTMEAILIFLRGAVPVTELAGRK